MSDRFWRGVFLSAAVVNWIVGAVVAFDTSETAASMGVETLRYDPFYSPFAGMFIFLFGLLYFAVWRDLSNRAIVVIGTIGKLGAFAQVTTAALRGLVSATIGGLVFIDLFYAILFALFLFSRRAAPARS